MKVYPMDVVASVRKIARDMIVSGFFRTISYSKKNVIDDILTENPYDFSSSWQDKFFEAMKCSFLHHSTRSDFYKKLCRQKGFDASSINSFDDIWDIPFILSDVFKTYHIETRTGDLITSEMSSSGTSGRKSKIRLDRLSAERLMFSMYHINRALGLASLKPVNYFMMSYNPNLDDTLGTTNSDVAMSYLTPRNSVFYGLDTDEDGKVGFLKNRSVEKMREYIEEDLPIRMLGFVHHICEVIIEYNNRYGRMILPKDSYMITGGGWKGAKSPYGELFEFNKFLKENTSIDLRNVRDLYTLIEHEIFYLECEEHNKHIPNVALACARDPRSLKRLGFGEKGLIHLYSPLIESCPTFSLLTTDYGHIEESCPCKIGGPYIKIIGRAGVTKKVTCALTADEYIKGSVNE